ncbi:MAG: hypothetical protein WHT08_11100 [Bryobacteraceae bacterium]
MRTTLHLDDAAYQAAVRHARRRRIGVGKAVSELILRAVQLPVPAERVDGVLLFDPPADVPEIKGKDVQRILEEEDGE